MPAWNDYKAHAIERGSLAKELYMVRSKPGSDPSRIPEILPEHLAFQAEQEANGNLFLAGPLSDESGDNMLGEGLIIYRAESLEAAKAITEQDPFHAKGIRTFEIRRWMVNEGSLTLKVSLSSQKVEI